MNNEVVSTVSSGFVWNSPTKFLLAGLRILVPTATTSGKALSKTETKILYMGGHDDGSETFPKSTVLVCDSESRDIMLTA